MIKNTQYGKTISNSLSFFKFFPLTPNQITLLAVILAFISFIIFSEMPYLSFGLIIFSFLLDAIDGSVARAKGLVSEKGAFIDGISDRIVEFFLILILMMNFLYSVHILIALIIVLFFGTCMTSFVKAYAHHSNLITREKALGMPGILERTERSIFIISVLALFLFGFSQYAIPLSYLAAILSATTFIQRLYWVLKQTSVK